MNNLKSFIVGGITLLGVATSQPSRVRSQDIPENNTGVLRSRVENWESLPNHIWNSETGGAFCSRVENGTLIMDCESGAIHGVQRASPLNIIRIIASVSGYPNNDIYAESGPGRGPGFSIYQLNDYPGVNDPGIAYCGIYAWYDGNGNVNFTHLNPGRPRQRGESPNIVQLPQIEGRKYKIEVEWIPERLLQGDGFASTVLGTCHYRIYYTNENQEAVVAERSIEYRFFLGEDIPNLTTWLQANIAQPGESRPGETMHAEFGTLLIQVTPTSVTFVPPFGIWPRFNHDKKYQEDERWVTIKTQDREIAIPVSRDYPHLGQLEQMRVTEG